MRDRTKRTKRAVSAGAAVVAAGTAAAVLVATGGTPGGGTDGAAASGTGVARAGAPASPAAEPTADPGPAHGARAAARADGPGLSSARSGPPGEGTAARPSAGRPLPRGNGNPTKARRHPRETHRRGAARPARAPA
ncbi:hypothetical protein RKE29_12830 [Streptomyces sp. B1866]|uniref:hypothetical protein n=1 Tax=Streptomyces sp. B1866 TaxID=3075431 RepID=UPI00288FABA4|nr:hypothetical protein [Streptomyces sp. B1866]MDT3397525.1 hypothetical protein [Streptomyces sp. B1866]